MALSGALGVGLVARDAAAFCLAGVAQSHIHLRFAWQAWHNLTFTFVSRGRRGTQWRAWTWFSRPWRPWRRGIWQSHIYLRFAWQAWHSWHSVARLDIVALTTSYIRVLHFCGQVPFLYVIIVGFMAVGQARLSRSTSRCTTWSTEDHGTPHSAHSRSAVLPHAEQMTLQRWQKNVCTVARSRHFHTHHLSRATLSHTYTWAHIHTYIRTYVRTCILSFHILSHTVFHHLLCLSFLPRPRYNLWSSVLEEVDLWGYPIL